MKNVEFKVQYLILLVTGTYVQFDNFIVLSVLQCQQPPKLPQTFEGPENIAEISFKILENVVRFVLISTVSTPCDHTRNKNDAKSGSVAECFPIKVLLREVDDVGSQQKLETCKHLLFDSEMEIGRHKVVTFVLDSLTFTVFFKIENSCFIISKLKLNGM